MLTIQLRDAAFRITSPRIYQYSELLEQAETFVAHEATMPTAGQTAVTPQINALLAQARPVYGAIEQYDNARVEGAERLKPLDKLAQRYFDRARRVLGGLYADEPARVQAWGFEIRQTGRRAGQIEPVEGRRAYLRFFEKYVTFEESRPAEEQFRFVPLEEMRRVRDGLQTYWRQRNLNAAEAQQQRAILRQQLLPRLNTYLRIAFSLIVMDQYDGVVQPDLKKWGFQIASRQSLLEGVGEVETAEPELELPPSDDTTFPIDFTLADPDTGVTGRDLVAEP